MTNLTDLARREWQPIETAPPKRVLVLLPEFPMGDLPPLPPRVTIRHMADLEDNAREIRQPTHWMPLPEPPAALIARSEA